MAMVDDMEEMEEYVESAEGGVEDVEEVEEVENVEEMTETLVACILGVFQNNGYPTCLTMGSLNGQRMYKVL